MVDVAEPLPGVTVLSENEHTASVGKSSQDSDTLPLKVPPTEATVTV
jgi:hypothetical protein